MATPLFKTQLKFPITYSTPEKIASYLILTPILSSLWAHVSFVLLYNLSVLYSSMVLFSSIYLCVWIYSPKLKSWVPKEKTYSSWTPALDNSVYADPWL